MKRLMFAEKAFQKMISEWDSDIQEFPLRQYLRTLKRLKYVNICNWHSEENFMPTLKVEKHVCRENEYYPCDLIVEGPFWNISFNVRNWDIIYERL